MNPERCKRVVINGSFGGRWDAVDNHDDPPAGDQSRLPAAQYRHPDHRFKWTRQEFQQWATKIAGRFGYTVRFVPVGPEHEKLGPPTQMGVFQQKENDHGRFP